MIHESSVGLKISRKKTHNRFPNSFINNRYLVHIYDQSTANMRITHAPISLLKHLIYITVIKELAELR